MRKIYLWVFKALGFFAIAILTINIEGVATALGINAVLSSHLSEGERMLRDFLVFLHTPILFYGALVLLGATVSTWTYEMLGRLERRKPKPPIWFVASNCIGAAISLRRYRFQRHLENIEGTIERANRGLSAYGIDGVKITDLENPDERERASRHFRTIYGPLSNGDVAAAIVLSRHILDNPKFVTPSPPPPPSTGPGTPP